MLPIRCIGPPRIGRTGGRDIAAGALGQILQMRRQGRGCCGRSDGGGNTGGLRRAVRRSRALRSVNFAVFVDDLRRPSIMRKMNDKAILSDII